MAIKKPKTFKKVTETADTKVTIEVEEKTVPAVEADVKAEEVIEEDPQDKSETAEARGAIAQANAKIQEENEEKVGQSIKDEVNEDNKTDESSEEETEEDNSDEKEDKQEESSDAEAKADKEAKDESIIDETGGMSWKRIFLFAFLAGCIGIFIVGLLMYVNRNFNISKKAEVKQINLPKETPTPTVGEVDKDAYEIEVLNGSGISGEAANVEGILEDDGFTVSGIGNADNQNYTNTVIAAKDDVKQGFIDELQKTLETRGAVEVIKLSETGSDSDVVVTVGSDLNEEDADASPTPKLE